MVLSSMFPQPGGILQHWKPPLVQDALYCAAKVLGLNGVDQSLWVRPCKSNPLLTDHVTLDDPVASGCIQVEPSFVYGGAGSIARGMLPNVPFGNIGAFQFC